MCKNYTSLLLPASAYSCTKEMKAFSIKFKRTQIPHAKPQMGVERSWISVRYEENAVPVSRPGNFLYRLVEAL